MSAYEITVSVTALCTSCGGELGIGCTEAKPSSHPFERDNPLERTARRVFVSACEKCFMFRPHAAELLELAQQYASECGECDGKGIPEFGEHAGHPCPQCADIRAVIAKAVQP